MLNCDMTPKVRILEPEKHHGGVQCYNSSPKKYASIATNMCNSQYTTKLYKEGK
jgi:hypothetical protein